MPEAWGHGAARGKNPERLFLHIRSSSWTGSWVQFSLSEVYPGITAVVNNVSWLWLKINKMRHFRAPGTHPSNRVRSWGLGNPLCVLHVSRHGKAVRGSVVRTLRKSHIYVKKNKEAFIMKSDFFWGFHPLLFYNVQKTHLIWKQK